MRTLLWHSSIAEATENIGRDASLRASYRSSERICVKIGRLLCYAPTE